LVFQGKLPGRKEGKGKRVGEREKDYRGEREGDGEGEKGKNINYYKPPCTFFVYCFLERYCIWRQRQTETDVDRIDRDGDRNRGRVINILTET